MIEELIDEVERIVQDSKKLIDDTKALEKSSGTVTNEIGLIYEEIRDNANQLKENCTEICETPSIQFDSRFISRIRKKLKESERIETLSLDTPEKVVAAEPREEKYNQKLLLLDRAEENYRITSKAAVQRRKSYSKLLGSVNAAMAFADRNRITPHWWKIYRTQGDLEKVKENLWIVKEQITGFSNELGVLNDNDYLWPERDFEDNLTPGPHCKAWLESNCSSY